MNPFLEWIPQFLRYTMTWMILDDWPWSGSSKGQHSKTEQYDHEKKEKVAHAIHKPNYCDDRWKGEYRHAQHSVKNFHCTFTLQQYLEEHENGEKKELPGKRKWATSRPIDFKYSTSILHCVDFPLRSQPSNATKIPRPLRVMQFIVIFRKWILN